MLFHKSEAIEHLHTGYMVGFDLGNKTSQISYVNLDGQVDTLPVVTGTQQFNIPTVLFKRAGVNQWFYGKEALKKAETEEGSLFDNLLELAIAGNMILVEGEEKSPVALLTLFIKRSLGLFSMIGSVDQITSLMVTCQRLDHSVIEVLRRVCGNLSMKHCQMYFQSHVESFYYYNISQPANLWDYDVLVCHLHEDKLRTYRMECNKHTTPIVAYVEQLEHEDLQIIREEERDENTGKKLDQDFMEVLKKVCEGHIISSVYLIGDGFQGEWMRDSLRFLCQKRRVFVGNNLYSKGACYSLLERQNASEAGSTHVFLGNDKLKSNVGLNVLRQGEESYLALLDAGINWFDTAKSCDVILENGNSFLLTITPLTKKAQVSKEIVLENLIPRPDCATRLHIEAYCKDESTMCLKIEDKGFGEIYPSTGQVWEQEVEL